MVREQMNSSPKNCHFNGTRTKLRCLKLCKINFQRTNFPSKLSFFVVFFEVLNNIEIFNVHRGFFMEFVNPRLIFIYNVM